MYKVLVRAVVGELVDLLRTLDPTKSNLVRSGAICLAAKLVQRPDSLLPHTVEKLSLATDEVKPGWQASQLAVDRIVEKVLA